MFVYEDMIVALALVDFRLHIYKSIVLVCYIVLFKIEFDPINNMAMSCRFLVILLCSTSSCFNVNSKFYCWIYPAIFEVWNFKFCFNFKICGLIEIYFLKATTSIFSYFTCICYHILSSPPICQLLLLFLSISKLLRVLL